MSERASERAGVMTGLPVEIGDILGTTGKKKKKYPQWSIRNSAFHLIERDCPVCGKKFYHGKEWAYYLRIGMKDYMLCSWTCYRKMEREKAAALVYKKRGIREK